MTYMTRLGSSAAAALVLAAAACAQAPGGEAAPMPAVAPAAAPDDPPSADPAALLLYVGSYVTQGPVVTIAMGADSRLTAQVGDSPALPMKPVGSDAFVVEQANARVVFQRENGRVNGVTVFHRGRELNGRREAASR